MTDSSNMPAVPGGEIILYNDGTQELQVRLEGETVWLTQRGLAALYQIKVPTVNHHIASIYEDSELSPEATVRQYLIVQLEGEREVQRTVDHYNLDMILAIGYRVRSAIGTRFRQWATARLSELLVKGFTMDDERLKAGQSIGADYFDELLERIRDIRASERRFYQKITDIYATASDYDNKLPDTQTFFGTVQNKLEWAITGMTAAEIIHVRADADKENMGLATWKNAPDGSIRKGDVTVAKNYLSQEEIGDLNRIVTMYLDYAEDQATRHQPMTMNEWADKLDAFLQFNDRAVLQNSGSVKKNVADALAKQHFEVYTEKRRAITDKSDSDFDTFVKKTTKRAKGEAK